jgi:cytochrome c553
MLVWLLLAAAAQNPVQEAPASPPKPPPAAAPAPTRVGTMSELMVKIIYPSSDAVFYITTRTPKNEVEWNELQAKTLMLAESANLLMLPIHARDQERWVQDAKLMLDAGTAAFKAAKAKDVAALDALNDKLYTSCTTCHQHYRPNYGKRPPG